MPPKPTTNTGDRLPQPTQPGTATTTPAKPARKVPASYRSPVVPSAPVAPRASAAPQPEYAFDYPPTPEAPQGQPEQQYAQPQRPAPPTEQDAFARLEALALEQLDATQEQATLDAVHRAAQEFPSAAALDVADPSGGLRRVEGGGFEFNGSPNDRMKMDVHSSRPSAAPGIPPPDDSAMQLRKKMRAQGMRNLAGAPHAPAVPAFDFAAPEPQAKVDETQLSLEDRRFIDDVRSRIRTIGEQDAWARLGVTRNASSDQIRAAYLEAAKRYHPDHAAAAGFAGIQDELRSLFQSVKDAYDQIATAPAREAYANALKQGTSGKVRDRKEEAALSLKMGEALLKKRDFAAALVKLRRSVEFDPNGDSLAALGWGLMCDPATSPAGKEEAATLLSKALRAHGLSARTYYVAGVLWRTKDPDSAADAFRKALELEPNHADASLELRLLEMRQGKKSSGGGVLSTLLFGKKR